MSSLGRSNTPKANKSLSFYLFSLPVYLSLKNWLLLTTLFSALIAGVVYWERGCVTLDQQRLRMAPAALVHASALLALFFAVKAWSYYLDRFLLLYGDNGVVVGASYTDLTMGLPVLWVLIGLSGIAAVASLTNLQVRTYRLPLAAVVLVFGSSFVLGEVTPVAAVPALVTALQDTHANVRQAAAEALGQIGPAAVEAVPALVTALQDT